MVPVNMLLALLPALAGILLAVVGLLGWVGRLSVQGQWEPASEPNRKAGRAQVILGGGLLVLGLALRLPDGYVTPVLVLAVAAMLIGAGLRWFVVVRHGLGPRGGRG